MLQALQNFIIIKKLDDQQAIIIAATKQATIGRGVIVALDSAFRNAESKVGLPLSRGDVILYLAGAGMDFQDEGETLTVIPNDVVVAVIKNDEYGVPQSATTIGECRCSGQSDCRSSER